MAFGLTITRVKVRGSMETVMFLGDPRSGTLLKAGLTWWFNVKSSLEGCPSLVANQPEAVSLFPCPLFFPTLSFRARPVYSFLAQISRYITHSLLRQSPCELGGPDIFE
ncbi:hypothetical protein V6000_009262 [Aspergillus fumigatus]|jgi:hypothetical protein